MIKWIVGLLVMASGVTASSAPVALTVRNAAPSGARLSGRLIVFLKPLGQGEPLPTELNASPYESDGTAVASREIQQLSPGAVALIDGDTDSFPTPFSSLPPGRYAVQALLDRNHDYAYRSRREGGDVVSPVVEARIPAVLPELRLDHVVPAKDLAQFGDLPPAERSAYERAVDAAQRVTFVSPSLTRFWGRPVTMNAWVALPPGYDAGKKTKYPVLYFTSGFSSSMTTLHFDAVLQIVRMEKGETPPIIWVFLDHGSALGPHEFANSVSNGPWSSALVGEFIPHL